MAYICKDRHGTFYLRIVLNNSTPKREIRRSLGTKSRREALRRQPSAYVQVMQDLQGPSTPVLKRSVPKIDRSKFLSVLLKKYIKHQEMVGILPQTIRKAEFAAEILIKLVKDKPVDAYTKEDARKFRDKALLLPKKGYSDTETISITTFNNYSSNLIALFKWFMHEGYVLSNVFLGIKIKRKVKASSYRDIFNQDDLQKIFNAIESTPDIRKERYFVPYLAYYSGCRIGEACMLSVDDVRQVDGIWCIHINDGKPYQRLKNSFSERIVPIHSELIKLGFLEYVESVGDSMKGEDRLFPNLRITKGNTFSAQLSQWFGKLLRQLEIGPKKTFHSFRHTFSHNLKSSGVDVSIAQAILGHATGSISYDRYGKSVHPSTLVDAVERIGKI